MASTTMFVSCGSDDSDSTPAGPVATSITLSASLTTIQVGQSVTLTVTDNLTNNVTGASTFTANGVALTGPTFTGATVGTFSIVAKNGDLTSAAVVVTVTAANIEADNSFVINGTQEFVTPDQLFRFDGFAAANGQDYILWSYNPYNEVMNGETPTYPNDLYITLVMPVAPPTAIDPETGDLVYTIDDIFANVPEAGEYEYSATVLPTAFILDVQFNANSTTASYLPTDPEDRAALIENVTLNIAAINLEAETTSIQSTYTISLTDGDVIEGDYSGETGIYGIPTGEARNLQPKKLSNFTSSKVLKSGKKVAFKR